MSSTDEHQQYLLAEAKRIEAILSYSLPDRLNGVTPLEQVAQAALGDHIPLLADLLRQWQRSITLYANRWAALRVWLELEETRLKEGWPWTPKMYPWSRGVCSIFETALWHQESLESAYWKESANDGSILIGNHDRILTRNPVPESLYNEVLDFHRRLAVMALDRLKEVTAVNIRLRKLRTAIDLRLAEVEIGHSVPGLCNLCPKP